MRFSTENNTLTFCPIVRSGSISGNYIATDPLSYYKTHSLMKQSRIILYGVTSLVYDCARYSASVVMGSSFTKFAPSYQRNSFSWGFVMVNSCQCPVFKSISVCCVVFVFVTLTMSFSFYVILFSWSVVIVCYVFIKLVFAVIDASCAESLV